MARREWHGDEAKRRAREAAARNLLAAGVFFTNSLRQFVNVSNPRPHNTPSKPGEYPRKRTGFGQAGIMMVPSSVADVMKDLVVRCGYSRNASYMLILELARKRKGLKDALKTLRPQLETYASGGVKGGA